MSFRTTFSRGLGLAAALSILQIASTARATVVERVVAVIGEQAIFLSDLRARAKPALVQIYERVPAGPQRAAFESQMLHELLDRMVDEKLEQVAADRARITVTTDEIDKGIRNIAEPQKITVEELLQEVLRSGFSLAEFRDEVRRQILEQKLMSLRVNPRVRISAEDVRIGYQRLQREERRRLGFRLQWIVIHIPGDANDEVKEEKRKLAEAVALEAKTGDFAALAAKYSDDGPSKRKGGDLGPAKPGELGQILDEAAFGLDVGEVSAPVSYKGDLVILRVAERDAGSLKSLSEEQERVAQEVFGERREKARRQWLDEIKRSVYVENRF
ncbi:MAG: peptidylprolyl isomerase [Polyangiaceae bacterium]